MKGGHDGRPGEALEAQPAGDRFDAQDVVDPRLEAEEVQALESRAGPGPDRLEGEDGLHHEHPLGEEGGRIREREPALLLSQVTRADEPVERCGSETVRSAEKLHHAHEPLEAVRRVLDRGRDLCRAEDRPRERRIPGIRPEEGATVKVHGGGKRERLLGVQLCLEPGGPQDAVADVLPDPLQHLLHGCGVADQNLAPSGREQDRPCPVRGEERGVLEYSSPLDNRTATAAAGFASAAMVDRTWVPSAPSAPITPADRSRSISSSVGDPTSPARNGESGPVAPGLVEPSQGSSPGAMVNAASFVMRASPPGAPAPSPPRVPSFLLPHA